MNLNEIFEKIRWLDIHENTSNFECQLLMKMAERNASEGCVFVEIGSWKGKSAAMLGHVAQHFNGTVYCVDHFEGNPTTGRDEIALAIDLFSIFRQNMRELGFWQKVVKPLVMDSISASKIFKDDSVDFLFLDAGHFYHEVHPDLECWKPKMKVGGVICGHDCQEYYLDVKEETDAKYATIDCGVSEKLGKQIHFGVIKAVDDHFGSNYKILKPTSLWVSQRKT